MTQHGVFMVSCPDNPRGYVWDAFYMGEWLGSYDYQQDAEHEFVRAGRR